MIGASPRVLRPVPLTAEAFAPFGDVVSAGLREGVAANLGTAIRTNFCAGLRSTRPEARPNLAVFRSAAQRLPFDLRLLEKHPCSTQAFLPLVCTKYLVCVAGTAEDGGPDSETVRAFVCLPGQGINYHVGVWHHPILALDTDADFAMLAWEDGSPLDCVERALPQPIRVLAPEKKSVIFGG